MTHGKTVSAGQKIWDGNPPTIALLFLDVVNACLANNLTQIQACRTATGAVSLGEFVITGPN